MNSKDLNDKVKKLKLKKGDIVLIKSCFPMMGIHFNDLSAGVIQKVSFHQEKEQWTILTHSGAFVSKSTKQSTIPSFCDIEKITAEDLATRHNLLCNDVLDNVLKNAEIARKQLQL